MKEQQKTWTISQLAEELGISPSKIRYYEKVKLLNPQRSKGQQRILDKRDRTRLKLIMRGTHLGLSLEQISEVLGLDNDYPPEKEQLRRALTLTSKIKRDLEERKNEIARLEEEVDIHIERMQERLTELEKN